MKSINVLTSSFLVVSLLIGSASAQAATTQSTQQQDVMKFVNQAKTYVKQHGRYQAIMAFNDSTGQFRSKDKYIFAFVCGAGSSNGFSLASNPDLESQDTFSMAVMQKSAHVKKIVNGATVEGKWNWSSFDQPTTHTKKPKHSYVVLLPKYQLCIGSGYYK